MMTSPFTSYRHSCAVVVLSEIADIEQRIEDRSPELFGRAGLLDSVSEYLGGLRRVLHDIEEAASSNEVDLHFARYINDFPGC